MVTRARSRCRMCDTILPARVGAGRPPAYCGNACRQRAKRDRARTDPASVGESVRRLAAEIDAVSARARASGAPEASQAADMLWRCAQKMTDIASVIDPTPLPGLG